MKRITLFHTVIPTVYTLGPAIKAALGEDVAIRDIYDNGISRLDPDNPFMMQNRLERMYGLIHMAQLGTDLFVVACSSLSVETQLIKPFFRFPVVGVDDRMLATIVAEGKPVTVFSTSPTPKPSMMARLEAIAAETGATLPPIKWAICSDALPFLLKDELDTVKKMSLAFLDELPDRGDTIVYSQGSSGFMKEEMEQRYGCRVMRSTEYVIEDIREALQKME